MPFKSSLINLLVDDSPSESLWDSADDKHKRDEEDDEDDEDDNLLLSIQIQNDRAELEEKMIEKAKAKRRRDVIRDKKGSSFHYVLRDDGTYELGRPSDSNWWHNYGGKLEHFFLNCKTKKKRKRGYFTTIE